MIKWFTGLVMALALVTWLPIVPVIAKHIAGNIASSVMHIVVGNGALLAWEQREHERIVTMGDRWRRGAERVRCQAEAAVLEKLSGGQVHSDCDD